MKLKKKTIYSNINLKKGVYDYVKINFIYILTEIAFTKKCKHYIE